MPKSKKTIRYTRAEVQLWNVNLHILTLVRHLSSYQKLGSDSQQWGYVGVNRQGHEKPVSWCNQMKFALKAGTNLKSAAAHEDYHYYEDYILLSLQGEWCAALLCKPGRKHQSFLKQEEIVQNSPFLPLLFPPFKHWQKTAQCLIVISRGFSNWRVTKWLRISANCSSVHLKPNWQLLKALKNSLCGWFIPVRSSGIKSLAVTRLNEKGAVFQQW